MDSDQPGSSPRPPGGTIVFIDAAYLLTVLAAQHGATMSTTIFDSRGIAAKVGDLVAARLGADQCSGRGRLSPDPVELRWYDAVDPTKRVETPWVAALHNHPGTRLRLGRTTIRDDSRLQQKRVDTLLVADVVESVYSPSPPSDVAIVSGDEDLTPAVDVAIARGARVHLVTLTVDGFRQGVSHHLRLSATSELPVDIGELAPLARSRAHMFAQMAGLVPKAASPAPDVDAPDGKAPNGDDRGGSIDHLGEARGGAAVSASVDAIPAAQNAQSCWQPQLPGMPPDPPQWADEIGIPPSVNPDDLVVVERSTLEERVQAGQVSRAYLAGRAYARRWLRAEPCARAGEVAVILASHPYLPHSVDTGLMKFAAQHVGLGPGGRYNRVDVRAGFSAGVRLLAGVITPDGVDALTPDSSACGDGVVCWSRSRGHEPIPATQSVS